MTFEEVDIRSLIAHMCDYKALCTHNMGHQVPEILDSLLGKIADLENLLTTKDRQLAQRPRALEQESQTQQSGAEAWFYRYASGMQNTPLGIADQNRSQEA